jgi:predicted amidohydrolase
MKAAVAQFAADVDKDANLKAITAHIEEAARQGAQLVVLPENAMYSNPDPRADVRPFSESLAGQFAQTISALAQKNSIAVVAGMTERPSEDAHRPANAVIAIAASGDQIGAYRKVHLYDAFGYRESDRIEPHTPQPLTFELEGITFGVMTCYDLRFPEMARYLVDAGAEAIIIPAAWVAGPAKEDHWLTLARARAIENTAYVLACGQTGPVCTGQSAIIDPMGTVLASGGEIPSVSTAELNQERLAQVRQKNPSLANRRFTVAPR